jgi:hypothetical protein
MDGKDRLARIAAKGGKRQRAAFGPPRAASFAVLCCFSSKLSASGAFSSTETLDFGHYRTEKNSGEPLCFSLFFAIIGCRLHPPMVP